MARLTAADSWFLYAETERVHTHVTGAMVLDPSTSPVPFDRERLRAHIEAVAPPIEGFRQRLVDVPLGIDHPLWMDDPDFDIDRHISFESLPAPGSDEELADFIGEFASTQLPRDRPLWEMVLLDGLADGRIALVSKMHHTIMDGSTGVDLMANLLSLTPDSDPVLLEQDPAPPRSVPGPALSMIEAAVNRAKTPSRPFRAGWRTVEGVVRGASTILSRRGADTPMAGPFAAPRTPWNGALTASRTVAFADVDFDMVRETKAALDVTVNDIVLSACTLGLRRVLAQQGAHVDQPLVAAIPVSVHGQADPNSINQVSNMFAHLPVDLSDPVEIARQVHSVANGAKEVQAEMGPDLLGDIVDLLPPPIFSAGAELWSRARVADHLPPIQNLIVSNVPGSPVPLYMAGAEVVGLHPFGPLIEGSGLNVTVLSHLDTLQVGVIACPDLVGDVWGITEAIIDGFHEMHRSILTQVESDHDGSDNLSADASVTSPRNENYAA